MTSGFFDLPTLTAKPAYTSLYPKCGACKLDEGCLSPKMPVTGEGRKGVLIVAEAPGKTEDDQNEQLVGDAGQLLREVLRKIGIDLDRDCWKTNAIICRPPDNRTPTKDEIEYCRPNVLKAIRDLEPRMIIPLGLSAVKSVIGPLWKEDVGSMSQWLGWKMPSQKYNTWIAPTYHPSYLIRAKGGKQDKEQREYPVIRLWFERHLKEAFELEGRPWKEETPDYASEVRVIFDPAEAAKWINGKLTIAEVIGGKVAFDFETNMLKPDSSDAEIVCCSVCWNGVETIAYPMVGEAISATRKLLKSDMPKIGWNKKFETRWARACLGVDVNNWEWDGMLSAHHLDCREGITSAKFQGLVRLGISDWSEEIKPYLSAVDGTSNGKNRIKEVNLRSLLVYCGIDSLVEWKIAKIQKREMEGN